MPSKILRCTCKHEGQDKLNGPQMRVFNFKGKSRADSPEYRCTVCGATVGSKPTKK